MLNVTFEDWAKAIVWACTDPAVYGRIGDGAFILCRCSKNLRQSAIRNDVFTAVSAINERLRLNLRLVCLCLFPIADCEMTVSGQLSFLLSAGREMSIVAYDVSVASWCGGMSASCKPRIQLFADAGSGWPHSALPMYSIISSCQSAATS